MGERQHVDISKFLAYITRNSMKKKTSKFILLERERNLSITMIRVRSASLLDHIMLGGNFVWILKIVYIVFTFMYCSMQI